MFASDAGFRALKGIHDFLHIRILNSYIPLCYFSLEAFDHNIRQALEYYHTTNFILPYTARRLFLLPADVLSEEHHRTSILTGIASRYLQPLEDIRCFFLANTEDNKRIRIIIDDIAAKGLTSRYLHRILDYLEDHPRPFLLAEVAVGPHKVILTKQTWHNIIDCALVVELCHRYVGTTITALQLLSPSPNSLSAENHFDNHLTEIYDNINTFRVESFGRYTSFEDFFPPVRPSVDPNPYFSFPFQTLVALDKAHIEAYRSFAAKTSQGDEDTLSHTFENLFARQHRSLIKKADTLWGIRLYPL